MYPKLLNHYTRLMRHNVLVTLIAYILLTITQLTSLKEASLNGCVLYGNKYSKYKLCTTYNLTYIFFLPLIAYALQYAFITAFTILTVMSYELWTSIK